MKKSLLCILGLIILLTSCNSYSNTEVQNTSSNTEVQNTSPNTEVQNTSPNTEVQNTSIPTLAVGGNIGGILYLDASYITNTPLLEEKTKKYDNSIEIVYYNVYQVAGSFVIGSNGYIKSLNRGTSGLMRINISDSILVYGCDSTGNKKEPEAVIEKYTIIDGKQSYVIGMYSNFMIYNSGNDDVNIGQICLWN